MVNAESATARRAHTVYGTPLSQQSSAHVSWLPVHAAACPHDARYPLCEQSTRSKQAVLGVGELVSTV
eukprot:2384645-Pyramimonas_sp.AAC.1